MQLGENQTVEEWKRPPLERVSVQNIYFRAGFASNVLRHLAHLRLLREHLWRGLLWTLGIAVEIALQPRRLKIHVAPGRPPIDLAIDGNRFYPKF